MTQSRCFGTVQFTVLKRTVWFSFHWIVQRHMSICLYRSDCITVKERERVEAEEENVEAARKKQEEERKRESQKVGYPYSVRGSQYAFC